jgi:hypothetical protein
MGIEHLLNDPQVDAARIARGTVVEIAADGTVVALIDGSEEEVRCDVLQSARGDGALMAARDSILVWSSGRAGARGVVLGRIGATNAAAAQAVAPVDSGTPAELVIEATENLTLRCGQGSIMIRRDGRVLIKGNDLVSHAQRVNRIRGGSVAIN